MSAAVRIAILADAARARREINSVGDAAQRQRRGLSKLSGALKSGLALGAAAAVGAAAKDALTSGIAYTKVLKQTDVALKANANVSGQTAQALKERAANIETVSGALLDENDVLAGQQNLLRGGIKGEKAFSQAAQVTADLAAARGSTFEAASKTIQKALLRPEKATAALAKQGVILTQSQQDMIKAMVKAGNTAGAQGIVLDALGKKYTGAAQAAGSDSTAGFRRLQDTFQDLGRDLAVKFLPVAAKVAKFLTDNQSTVLAVAGALAVLGAGVLAVSAVTKVMTLVTSAWSAATSIATGVQYAWNLALSLNPVTLVVIAVVALVAVLFLLFKRSEKVRAAVGAMFGALKSGVSSAIGFVTKNWPTILAVLTGPVGLAVLAFTKYRKRIVSLFVGIKNTVVGLFSGIGAAISATLRSAVNTAISLVNKPIEAINAIAGKVPGVPDLPLIPALASGGIVRARSGGVLALLAEGGKDEAVVPLDGRFGNETTIINVYVTAGIGNPVEMGRESVKAIQAYERARGRRVVSNAAA
jgi:hypothetical protein